MSQRTQINAQQKQKGRVIKSDMSRASRHLPLPATCPYVKKRNMESDDKSQRVLNTYNRDTHDLERYRDIIHPMHYRNNDILSHIPI